MSLSLSTFRTVSSSGLQSIGKKLASSAGLKFHHCVLRSNEINSSLKRLRISLAGLPPTIEWGSMSLVTTE